MRTTLFCACLVLIVFSTPGFSKSWTGSGGNSDWSNANNWSPTGVPTINDTLSMDMATSFTISITSGNQYMGGASQLGVSSAGTATLNISGGTLTDAASSYFIIGNATPGILSVSGGTVNLNSASGGNTWLGYSSTGTINLNSGTINTGYIQGGITANGHPIINMNGGTVNVGFIFWPWAAGAPADMHLDGGTINAEYLFGPSWGDFNASGATVNWDFSGGTLVLGGNITSLTGVTAYDGAGTVNYSYNSGTNKTTITGISPAKVWTGGGGNSSWTTAANWSPAAVPTINDTLYMGASSDFTTLISSGAQYMGPVFQIGCSTYGTGTATLNITGGSLSARPNNSLLIVGNGANGVVTLENATINLENTGTMWLGFSAIGTLNISSGTINIGYIQGGITTGGHPVINMTGGVINVGNSIYWPNTSGLAADMHLDGGTITAAHLYGAGGGVFNATGDNINLDFSGGTLILDSNITSLSGATAYHGSGTINYSYNAGTNKTTITGIPSTKTWTGSGGDNNWTNANNWSPVGVPTINHKVTIDKATNFTVSISSGDQYMASASVLGNTFAGTATLNISGGTLTNPNIEGTYFLIGNTTPGVLEVSGGTVNLSNASTANIFLGNSSTGTINISSGTINTGYIQGGLTANGTAIVNMTGGTINAGYIFWPWNSGAEAEMHLDGGTINAWALFGAEWGAFSATGNVYWDFSGGKLVLVGNILSLTGATAYDGNGVVVYDYNTASNQTVIYGMGKAYYVASTGGNDGNPGTLAQPFATLEGARGAIRNLSPLPDGGVVVFLRGGKYFRSSEFALTSQDVGTAAKPIVYRSYPGETARIVGGVELPGNGWTLVDSSDAYWGQIDTGARGNVYKMYLPNNGVSNVGLLRERNPWAIDVSPIELSFNGEMMKLAQWPNSGYATTSTINGTNSFTYPSGETRPTRWTSASDPWMFGYFVYYWADYYYDVSSINTGTRTITLSPQYTFTATANMPYRAINILMELDSTGEYYVERANNYDMIYFWPTSSISAGESIVSTLGENKERLVSTDGAEYITFKNVIFEMCRWDGISIKQGSHITIDGCTVRNIGSTGISINPENDTTAATYHRVQDCLIYNTGNKGIYLNGGNRATLEKSYNLVHNNNIYWFGRWTHCVQPAVIIHGCGNTVTHNYLHDAWGGAIVYGTWSPESSQYLDWQWSPIITFLGWRDGANDNVIAYNEITGVCAETSDAGVIYCGHDWGNQGNVVRYNFIHDIASNFVSDGTHGIYLDDCASGTSVFANTFYNIDGYAVFVGGGRDNSVENNVIAKCSGGYYADRRGVCSAVISEDANAIQNHLEKIRLYNYDSPPWSTAYPTLAACPNDYSAAGYIAFKNPGNDTFSKNIGWSNDVWTTEGKGAFCAENQDAFNYITISNNISNQDPCFVDEANLNLKLQPNSPAYLNISGFQDTQFEHIGLDIQ